MESKHIKLGKNHMLKDKLYLSQCQNLAMIKEALARIKGALDNNVTKKSWDFLYH